MKKYLYIFLALILSIAPTKAQIFYPFVENCGYEVEEYCVNISDYNLPNCMLEYQEYFSPECLAAFMEYDRERWSWDSEIYNIWYDLSDEQRARYRRENWEEMKQRESGGEHANFPKNPSAKSGVIMRIAPLP